MTDREWESRQRWVTPDELQREIELGVAAWEARRRAQREQRWLRVGFVIGWVVVFSLVCWAVAEAAALP